MDGDKKFLVEKLAEYAERNRFTSEELARLIRLSLQLERDCPGVQFVIPEGNACRVERELQRQAQISKRPEMSQKQLREKSGQAWM
ncbi:MAG: hypothetical protein ACYC9I_04780 [Desulfuromonadales bacterium]